MKSLSLPSLTSNFLQRSGIQIDNSLSTSWKQLGFVSMLTSCGFSKRSGIEATEVIYLLTHVTHRLKISGIIKL
ncbi:hypothetical protein L2734_19475 [Parashewanella spongiae]|nr:hypothetical protein [Parashewanella spongiae]MCL1080303.1 hypothetical protein [Parashewanella spongiae]